MTDIFAYLDQRKLRYERLDHAPVYTCAAAREITQHLPGKGTKNLFLRDGKGSRHFLLVAAEEKEVDLKALGGALGVKHMGLASAERLKEHLGIEPGAVSLLALVNDGEGRVELLVDRDLTRCEALHCHPLVNTCTLVIPWEDVVRLFEHTSHEMRVIEVPERKEMSGGTES